MKVMGSFAIDIREWLRTTTAAQRAKVSRSEYVRRAVREANERQQRRTSAAPETIEQ